ncbi:uncharacterized protein QC761_0006510 [Podospora bellae-mahoneyi]|uniref:Uncharacterized protein n=1 Tax=Podospora bellae-mahoneyi TaxID=2093777 RepID=A0ABR0FY88_9PEZI|nr:hypothetical protein QC761_0006510 [Podospora bellae-mahoneyi]
MRFRPKRNKGFETNGFTRSGGKNNHKDILEVEMKHGDMMVPTTRVKDANGCAALLIIETSSWRRKRAVNAAVDKESFEGWLGRVVMILIWFQYLVHVSYYLD